MIVEFGPLVPLKSDAEVGAMSDGDFYHYMLDKSHVEWAKWANIKSDLGLSKGAEECLAGVVCERNVRSS